MFKREEWPELGELVVATVTNVRDYGAYVKLDEYDKDGFLHISEISSSWVKNIRDHVREGQKVVLKVLRVSPEKGHIDLSLRRVTRRERIEKMLLWKRSKKAEGLLRSASQRLGITIDEIQEKVAAPLEKNYGDLYDGLVRVAREGMDLLLKLGVPEDIASVIVEVVRERIKIPVVKVKGVLNLVSTKPNGVLHIRKALLGAQNVKKPPGTKVEINVISAPKYQIEVSAKDYKEAEALLKQAVDTAINYIKDAGGQGSFSRS